MFSVVSLLVPIVPSIQFIKFGMVTYVLVVGRWLGTCTLAEWIGGKIRSHLAT